jgi:hypothetical protein
VSEKVSCTNVGEGIIALLSNCLYQKVQETMNQNTVFQDLQSLPPEAQKQVADFIAFLQTRYNVPATKRKEKSTPKKLADEAFIGIWRNRNDMQDSAEWVKQLRSGEWGQ